jgi:GntR family transcriptional regulator/MocR family aminotransferase
MTVTKASHISPLDPTAAAPFYRQIYDRFRNAIASGILKPGDRIPSARALTKELGLARGTIESAYSLLAAEGYILARGQAGTIVTPGLKLRAPVARTLPPSNSDVVVPSFRPDSLEKSGLAFPRDAFARCNPLTWLIPPFMACRNCGPRLPPISRFRVASTALCRRYSLRRDIVTPSR